MVIGGRCFGSVMWWYFVLCCVEEIMIKDWLLLINIVLVCSNGVIIGVILIFRDKIEVCKLM